MWLPAGFLTSLGFQQRSRSYWWCVTQFDLPAHAHLSIFVSSQWHEAETAVLSVDAFHVTFRVATDHLHFYDHEHSDQTWKPGGHTSRHALKRHGLHRDTLRDHADQIAARVVAAWGCVLEPR